MDLALRNAGEVTSGISPYEAQTLDYLNRVHLALISGGTIPVGKDTTVDIDEVWPWSKAHRPMILELQPKFDSATVSLTQGSEAGIFSVAPAHSVQGWYLKVDTKPEVIRIAQHTAGATAFEFDGAYPDDTGSGLICRVFKLDYDLIPSYVVVDESNDKVQWQEIVGTTLTGTLTHGTYIPIDLITHVASVMNSVGGSPSYSGDYTLPLDKFEINSDRAGSSSFIFMGDGSESEFSVHKLLGFDDESTTNAASIESTYVLGGIARLIEPIVVHKGTNREGNIYGIEGEAFQRNYTLTQISEGIPDRFFVYKEKANGIMSVRFNRYPKEKTRIEIDHVPVPHDLKDNSASIPLVPRKHSDVLEDAATFYIMLNKSDDRMQIYAGLMQGKLKAMIEQHRGTLQRAGKFFGQIVSRPDQVNNLFRRRNIFGNGSNN